MRLCRIVLALLFLPLTAWPLHAQQVLPDQGRRSPLDNLDSSRIPREDRFAWQPPELVAVLGEHRGRHWDDVHGVAFSPDGKHIASCGDDRVIRLWDAASLRELAVLKQHTRTVRRVAYSLDGKTLASASYDRTVVLWDMTASPPRTRAVFKLEGDTQLAFSPDGETLACSGAKGTVELWKVASGKAPQQDVVLRGPQKQAGCLAFSPDGKSLASDSEEGIVLWDLATQTQKAVVKTNAPYVWSVAFSPNGKMLACCGDNHGLSRYFVMLWDLSDRDRPREKAVLDKHKHQVFTVKFSPDGKTLAAGGGGATARLWNLAADGPKDQAVIKTGSWVWSLDFAPDGKTLVTGEGSGLVRLWDLKDSGPLERFTPKGHRASVSRLALARNGLLVSTGDRTLLWDLSGPEPRERHSLAAGGLPALSGDGKTLALGSSSGDVELWHVAGAKPRKRADVAAKHKLANVSGVGSVQISRDGKLLMSSGVDNKLRFWNLTKEEPTLQKQVDLDTSWCALSFFGKEDKLTVANYGHTHIGVGYRPFRTVRVWDLTSKAGPKASLEHGFDVVSVAFAPDGQTLATGSGYRVLDADPPPAGEVRLWRVSEEGLKKPGLVLEGVMASINAVAFSPDGQILAAAGVRGQVILWETMTGKKCREWQLPGAIQHLVFAPDGRHLLTAHGNGTVYVYRLSQGVKVPEDAATLWQLLALPDADRAYAAIWSLAADPRRALLLLKDRLKPAEALDDKHIQNLVDRLNDASFKERDRATAALEKLHDAGPALRRHLTQPQLSLEARQRLERILEKLERIPPVQLQSLRAIQILEQIGNDSARHILKRLADGASDARPTQRAREALERLAERSADLP